MGDRELLSFWRSSLPLGRLGLVLASCGAILFVLSSFGAAAEGMILAALYGVHLLTLGFWVIVVVRMHRAAAASELPRWRRALRRTPRTMIIVGVLAGVYALVFTVLASFVPRLTESESRAVLHVLSAASVFFGLLGSVLLEGLRRARE